MILIPITFIIKILFSYLISFYFKKENLYFKKSYPTYYFAFLNYGRFMINPIFNLPYFLIGMFFGLTHFTIQKGIYCSKISDSDIDYDNNDDDDDDSSFRKNINNQNEKYSYSNEIQSMPFLKIPARFVAWHRNQNILKLSILLVIFIIFFFFFVIIFYLFPNKDINEIFENEFINIIYRIDIELVIIFIHWGTFIIFLKANNFVAIFLSNIYWTMISKPYFSFILIINTTLLFIFYQSETMIEINSMNIFLYSIIGGTVTFIVTSLFYIFFELPYKRLIQLICSMINIKKDSNNENPSHNSSMCEDEDNNKF